MMKILLPFILDSYIFFHHCLLCRFFNVSSSSSSLSFLLCCKWWWCLTLLITLRLRRSFGVELWNQTATSAFVGGENFLMGGRRKQRRSDEKQKNRNEKFSMETCKVSRSANKLNKITSRCLFTVDKIKWKWSWSRLGRDAIRGEAMTQRVCVFHFCPRPKM